MPNKLHKQLLGLFTGIEFSVRKVLMSEYMQEMADFPFAIDPKIAADISKFSDEVRKLEPAKRTEANDKATKFFLSKGIVEIKYPDEDNWQRPNIWYGEDSACPEGMVSVKDLGSDADVIAPQIAEYSFSVRRNKAFADFFRESSSGDTGPSSDEIPPETVIPSTNGNNQ